MKNEIATLEYMGACDIVEQNENINGIKPILVFKCKIYPDGLMKKFRAQLCARGDQKLEVITFWRPMHC